MKKRIWALLLCVVMVAVAGGCAPASSPSTPEATDTGSTTSTAAPTQTQVQPVAGETVTYPLDTDETLSIWTFGMTLHPDYTQASQSPFHSGLSEKTGVKLEWDWPVSGSDRTTAFNLLIASGDLPDLIYYTWGSDADRYIEDGYILALNEVIPQYAPNLHQYLTDHPEVMLKYVTDAGNWPIFPYLKEKEGQAVFRGVAARGDWMKEQNLEIAAPDALVDIEYYENILSVMHEKYGAYYSTVDGWNDTFVYGVFDTMTVPFVSEGKVVHGRTQEGFREALKVFKKWYENGWLDPDFASITDQNVLFEKALNDKISMGFFAASSITHLSTVDAANEGSAQWVALPYPVSKSTGKVEFGQGGYTSATGGTAITTACKNVELAARFCDYGYSEEGLIYWNYGQEGVSFEYVDGNPIFKDEILNDPAGAQDALRRYNCSNWEAISIHLMDEWNQKSPEATVYAMQAWMNSNIIKYALPPVTATADEVNEFGALNNAINTYSNEMIVKFIMGQEDINDDAKWQAYLEQMDSLGVPRLLEIRNDQYQRYMAKANSF